MMLQRLDDLRAWLTPLSGLTITLLAVAAAFMVTRKRRHFHPGPAGLPIIGNLFDMPKENPWSVYQEWSKTYGGFLPTLSKYMLERVYRVPRCSYGSAGDSHLRGQHCGSSKRHFRKTIPDIFRQVSTRIFAPYDGVTDHTWSGHQAS